ncbi:nitroreductase [Mycobacterium sp. Root135]|nr:nitroreductase [Mycobacterium sp. Root135]
MSTLAGRMLRTRWLVRAPVSLYRFGFGCLFGQRMLLLQHRGRRSGIARYVVLEVVEHPRPDRYLIVSGFGEAAQWYRNLLAEPRVRVSVGRRRDVPAVARLLSTEESQAALSRYAEHHPAAWRRLQGALQSATGTDEPQLPMFAVDLGNDGDRRQES